MTDRSITSGGALTEPIVSIGTMVAANADRHGEAPAFGTRQGNAYVYRSWGQLFQDTVAFADFLADSGLRPGEHVALITANGYQRLAAELGILATGRVAVPVFPGYDVDLLQQLTEFSDVRMVVCDSPGKITALFKVFPDKIFVFCGDPGVVLPAGVRTLGEILAAFAPVPGRTGTAAEEFRRVSSDALAMIMYTSGTSAFPKGVMLTHGNIMSQQAALAQLWRPSPGMRFLGYLPWHHSFGGLFERFFALASGGSFALDDSFGRDAGRILENFAAVRPHVYFSVPKVYGEIVSRIISDRRAHAEFFHGELKFIFTAAAPLPLNISNVFRAAGVPVVEGWGLTETSPCATLTGMDLDRTPGIVGFPIPGVDVRLGEGDELEVRGPNVMRGYYKNPEATRQVLKDGGWFATGDIGELTPGGVRILSRKDRVFKLSNGEKVFPTPIEESLRTRCRFIKHAFVFGSGQKMPMALLFPNHDLFRAADISHKDHDECKTPDCTGDLAGCLGACIGEVNMGQALRYARIGRALVIDCDLLFEKGELTPSFKIVPRQVEKNYAAQIAWLLGGGGGELPAGTWMIEGDTGTGYAMQPVSGNN